MHESLRMLLIFSFDLSKFDLFYFKLTFYFEFSKIDILVLLMVSVDSIVENFAVVEVG